MNLWPLFSRKANADGSIRRSADLFSELFGARSTKSGASVNVASAMEVTTVLACARVIAEGMAQVPCKVFRAKGRDIVPATEHSLYRVLYLRPNDWMTSFEFMETMTIHCVLTGNAIAYKGTDMRGNVTELIPLRPGSVTLKQLDDYSLEYKVTAPNGSVRTLPSSAVWHWRGPSWDGVVGMDAVRQAREAIGLALVAEESQAKLHVNGLRVSGAYSMEGTLNAQQKKDLSEFLKTEYGGNDNVNKTMILDRAAKWYPNTISSVDAQHLETRRYQVEEICRAMRVMPIMVGYSDKAATYASAEQMFLAHVVHTLSPWYRRVEQSAAVNLLSERDLLDGVYVKFVAAGLLRGALKDTAEYLVKLTTNGIMTRNEAREKLEFNPLDGLDEPLTPINLTGAAESPADPAAEPGAKPDKE